MSELFTILAEKSPDALAVITESGQILYNNEKFSVLTSDHQGAENGQGSFFDLNLPEELTSGLQQSINSSETMVEKNVYCRTSGENPKQLHCRIIPCPGSVRNEFLVEIRDQTMTQKMQHELQEGMVSRKQDALLKDRRRKLFFGLLDDLPTFVYLQRKDYTVAFANKKVRKLFGDSEGRLCYEVFAGRSTPCPVCPTFEVFDTGMSAEWEFTDNTGRTFLIYDYPFEDENGEPLVLEMGVDITELKSVEKELFQAQKLRAIGVLAGGIAHDLNNNLVPIIFNIEYAKEKGILSEIEEPLEDALQAANRAAKLVAQVLEYSQQQDVSRSAVRLAPIIRECLKDMETSAAIDVALSVSLHNESDTVFANAAQMRQVVMNLLQNGLQAMPDGGHIEISTDILETKKGKFVRLKIRDNGIGMTSDSLERIFEPFYTSKKSSGGIGMGLAVVHSIITGSGGDIFVDSTPGFGTVFTVHLPWTEESLEVEQEELKSISGENIHLLLIDDDPGAISAMSRSLAQAGFIIDTASSGEEGLALFRQNPNKYGLILADQSMPGMTGLEMSEALLAESKQTPIVICTGHIEPTLEEQARKIGIAGFARKPMSPKALTEVIMQHCVVQTP